MSVQPTNKPEWATTDVTLPTAQTPNKIRPSEVLRTTGYDKDQVPTAQELNWQLNNIHLWIEHLLGRIEGVSSQPLLSLQDVYPIGSIYINGTSDINPSTLFGFGTWVKISQGRVLIGVGSTSDARGENLAFTLGQEGGEFKHMLSINEMAPHQHVIPDREYVRGINHDDSVDSDIGVQRNTATGLTSSAGAGQAHNNMQPYLAVNIWKRTA